jgi:type IV secretory pathway protease TraF
MLVLLTPPDALVPHLGSLPHALKQIAGLPGDTVCWSATAMVMPDGAPYPRLVDALRGGGDGTCRVLTADEVVLVGTHPYSLDSRDIGPVSVHRLVARLTPLWAWTAGQGREGESGGRE